MATILLVEDDLLTAQCYNTWLKASGHKIQQVTDVISAVDAMDKVLPDLILLDMLLHGASGVQLLHVLQSHADWQHVPIVVCSNALPAHANDLQAYGVRGVLNKATLTRQKLIATVKEVL